MTDGAPSSGASRPATFGDDFYSSVVDASPDGILVVDVEGHIRFANRHATEMFRLEHAELLERSVDDLVPDSLRHSHPGHRADYARDPKMRPMGVGLLLQAKRGDDQSFPVEISLSPLGTGDELLVVTVIRDITARVEAEARLRASEAALNAAEQAIAVGEDRERIARDLHDTVIQRLFACGLQLQAVRGRVDPEVAERIDGVVDGLDETIRDLRTAIFALQSSQHGELGLRGELLDAAAEAASALGYDPRLQFEGPVETIEEPVRSHVVPVCREALANVARHARARSARVILEVSDDVTVSVLDDGVGVPDDVHGGHGLRNLADRAVELGGELRVERGDEGGTMLVWRVPRAPA